MEIPLFRIYFDDRDIEAISDVIKSGMNWAVGHSINAFEKKIVEYFGCSYCVVFNSGTSALHALLLAHEIHNGHEVIVPSFTFISTANAPLFVKAKPILSDIELKTLGLDPDSVVEKISPKTKAIIPIHYGGCPAQISALKEIADDHNLLLIEDAAESFGATLNGQMTGTFGDSAMLSFCQNKVITTGEGGAIITDSKDVYTKLLLNRSHGRLDDRSYFTSAFSSEYVDLGYNFRLSNINAALGLSQLEKVEKIISMRLKVAQYYIEKLRDVNEIILPFIPSNGKHVFQLFSIRIKHGYRDELIDFLRSKGIMSKIYFSPVHLTYFYSKVLGYKEQLPITESISKEILSLPIYPTMTVEEQDYVVNMIKRFFGTKTLGESN